SEENAIDSSSSGFRPISRFERAAEASRGSPGGPRGSAKNRRSDSPESLCAGQRNGRRAAQYRSIQRTNGTFSRSQSGRGQPESAEDGQGGTPNRVAPGFPERQTRRVHPKEWRAGRT